MGQYHVGLDVHSRQSAFVIEDGEERVIAQGEVPTTRAAFEPCELYRRHRRRAATRSRYTSSILTATDDHPAAAGS